MFLCVNLVEILFHTLGYLLRLNSVRNKLLMDYKYPPALALTHNRPMEYWRMQVMELKILDGITVIKQLMLQIHPHMLLMESTVNHKLLLQQTYTVIIVTTFQLTVN